MRIKMLGTSCGPDGNYLMGKTYMVKSALGKALVEARVAVCLDADGGDDEAPTSATPEQRREKAVQSRKAESRGVSGE